MNLYLGIDLAIIAVALALLFVKKWGVMKQLPAILITIPLAGVPFILWDIVALKRRDWWFVTENTMGIFYFGLPLEEILFFVASAFALLVVYVITQSALKEKQVPCSYWIYGPIAAAALVGSFVLESMDFTSTSLRAVGLVMGIILFAAPELFSSRRYWIFTAGGVVVLSAIQAVISSIPVLAFQATAVSGIGFGAFPIEWVLFSYSFISLQVVTFTLMSEAMSA